MKRANALGLLCAVTGALLAGPACDAGPIVGGGCEYGSSDCDGTCVDLGSDPRHCGACGQICAEGQCVVGFCLGQIPPPTPFDAAAPTFDASHADGSPPVDAGGSD